MKVLKLAVFAMCCCMFAACGGGQKVEDSSVNPSIPEWVTKGSGAFKTDGTSVFYGVGMVSGVQNKSLAMQASDQRARAEIAKTLTNYVAVLTKDYMASTTAGDMIASSEEQYVSSTLKGFTEITLSGATIVDHWTDPSDGTLYSLAKLDLAAFKNTLNQSKELNAAVKQMVIQNADKAFSELDLERQAAR